MLLSVFNNAFSFVPRRKGLRARIVLLHFAACYSLTSDTRFFFTSFIEDACMLLDMEIAKKQIFSRFVVGKQDTLNQLSIPHAYNSVYFADRVAMLPSRYKQNYADRFLGAMNILFLVALETRKKYQYYRLTINKLGLRGGGKAPSWFQQRLITARRLLPWRLSFAWLGPNMWSHFSRRSKGFHPLRPAPCLGADSNVRDRCAMPLRN